MHTRSEEQTRRGSGSAEVCVGSLSLPRIRVVPPRSPWNRHGVLRPALDPSAEERHGPVGAGPEEGHKSGRTSGTPVL